MYDSVLFLILIKHKNETQRAKYGPVFTVRDQWIVIVLRILYDGQINFAQSLPYVNLVESGEAS